MQTFFFLERKKKENPSRARTAKKKVFFLVSGDRKKKFFCEPIRKNKFFVVLKGEFCLPKKHRKRRKKSFDVKKSVFKF